MQTRKGMKQVRFDVVTFPQHARHNVTASEESVNVGQVGKYAWYVFGVTVAQHVVVVQASASEVCSLPLVQALVDRCFKRRPNQWLCTCACLVCDFAVGVSSRAWDS